MDSLRPTKLHNYDGEIDIARASRLDDPYSDPHFQGMLTWSQDQLKQAHGLVEPQYRIIHFPILDRTVPVLRSKNESVMIAEDSTMLFLKLIDSLKGDLKDRSSWNIGSYHGALAAMLLRQLGDKGRLLATELRPEAMMNTYMTVVPELEKDRSLQARFEMDSSNLNEIFLESRSNKQYDFIFFNNPIFTLENRNANSSTLKENSLIKLTLNLFRRHLSLEGEAYMLTAELDPQARSGLSKAQIDKLEAKYLSPLKLNEILAERNERYQENQQGRKLEIEYPQEFRLKGSKEAVIYQIAKVKVKKVS